MIVAVGVGAVDRRGLALEIEVGQAVPGNREATGNERCVSSNCPQPTSSPRTTGQQANGKQVIEPQSVPRKVARIQTMFVNRILRPRCVDVLVLVPSPFSVSSKVLISDQLHSCR